MNNFITALQFLTLFRLRRGSVATREGLAASMGFFPLVGALQGAILVIIYYIFSRYLPWSVIAALSLSVLVLTNGGLHIDGFADTVDGLAGGNTPEERLRIMRDSSIGAIGAVFLVFIVLIKFAALLSVPFEARRGALFLFPVIGRWAMVPMARWAPYARAEGGLGDWFSNNKSGAFLIATIITAMLSVITFGVFSLAIIFAALVMVYFVTVFFKRRLGGVTGDVFGFQSEVAEAFFLVAALILIKILSQGRIVF